MGTIPTRPVWLTNTSAADMADALKILATPDYEIKELSGTIEGVLEEFESPASTFDCEHCHGITTSDYLGNCAACGAPRKKAKKFIPPATLYGEPITDKDAAAFIMGESKLEVNSILPW